jgi:hypothetical protein
MARAPEAEWRDRFVIRFNTLQLSSTRSPCEVRWLTTRHYGTEDAPIVSVYRHSTRSVSDFLQNGSDQGKDC